MNPRLDKLRKLRLTTEKKKSRLSIEVNALLDEQSLTNYLHILSDHIEASNNKVAASLFVKRYAFLPVIYLYVMTVWNEKLDITYSNLSIQTEDNEKQWLPKFYFHHLRMESLEEDRESWRIDCIKNLFKEHISPVMELLSHTTKVSKLILWENIAIYIFWLYETVLSDDDIPVDIALRAKEDFYFLISEATGNLFGDYDVNPLTRYYYEVSNDEVRKRGTCCYSYLTSNREYCSTCPKSCKKRMATK
ncbi:IucA/IucC family C-terminal-domain containing protein [Bacillus sp. FJAT-22090]|uniref:IucA/IucC family C-terminal-domain containing protein n=1 Tax=Bacillus sp. FJAT-22090 TaxID=1581038 RepID=UPI0011A53A67|nr:IucA/IucC family C-terminal-domain containing protein [Bacillus sp. FJAT-22090]